MDDRKARIAKLSERFKSQPSKPQLVARRRQRLSFYLDVETAKRIDKELKALNHAVYPQSVSKSAFMEAVLEYGMNNLNEAKALIEERMAAADPPRE